MDRSVTNRFIIPIGFGSSLLLLLSAYDVDNNFSPMTDNGTYYVPICILCFLTLIYFVIDFILMIFYYKPQYKIYFFHHLIGIISICIVFYRHYYSVKYLLSYLTYEISTIFLNISALYRRNGIINIYSRLSDFLFIFTYTLIRILFGTYLLFNLSTFIISMGIYIGWIVMPVGLQLLNYWWYYKIIIMTMREGGEIRAKAINND